MTRRGSSTEPVCWQCGSTRRASRIAPDADPCDSIFSDVALIPQLSRRLTDEQPSASLSIQAGRNTKTQLQLAASSAPCLQSQPVGRRQGGRRSVGSMLYPRLRNSGSSHWLPAPSRPARLDAGRRGSVRRGGKTQAIPDSPNTPRVSLPQAPWSRGTKEQKQIAPSLASTWPIRSAARDGSRRLIGKQGPLPVSCSDAVHHPA
jgi:hypothetical protein